MVALMPISKSPGSVLGKNLKLLEMIEIGENDPGKNSNNVSI